MNILDYINRINEVYGKQEPRITAQEPRNMELAKADIPRHLWDNVNTPDLEQSPDSFLQPGETLEDWDTTFRIPNAEGGVQQLVRNTADGSRPGYGGPGSGSRGEHRIKKPPQQEYFKDKDFVKWAKKNAPELFSTKSTVALYKQGIYMPDIFRKYETHLAKKNKIFGVVGLVEALGTDNPYSSTSIQTAFSQKNKKITKNMSHSERSKIKKGKKILEMIESVLGKPQPLKEVYVPFKYLKDAVRAAGTQELKKIWDLNPKQIKKINKLLNEEYGKVGLNEKTMKNIYDLFDDKKFMKEVRNYD